MGNASRLGLRVAAGLLFACSAGAGWAAADVCGDAKSHLLRSMEKGRHINVSAIIVQKGTEGSMQLKFEQARDGFERQTVLQPLSMQGVSMMDDGKRWMMYWPDERRALSQQSPRMRVADPDDRIRLADKNYVLKFGEATTIAGRKALAVVAEPRFKEMVERRYFIDEDTSFVLRVQKGSGSELETLLDTKAVTYPKSIPECCEMFSSNGVRVIERDPPVRIRPGMNARELVGFNPVLPSKLPFGFVIHEPQIVGSESRRFVAVRITDGLVNATVYQFDDRKESRSRDASGLQSNGIRFKIEGDLGSEARDKILRMFVKEIERAIGPISELWTSLFLLNGLTKIELWISIDQGVVISE